MLQHDQLWCLVRRLFLSLLAIWLAEIATGYKICCDSPIASSRGAENLTSLIPFRRNRALDAGACTLEEQPPRKERRLRSKEKKEILHKILEEKNSALIKDLVDKLKPEELFARVEKVTVKKEAKAPKKARVKEDEEEVILVEDTGYDEPTQINHVKQGSYVLYKDEIYTISAIQHIAQARMKGHYKVKMQWLHTTRESSFSFPDGAKLNVLVPRKFPGTFVTLDKTRGVYVFKTELSEVLIPSDTNIANLRYLKPDLKVTLIRWKDKVLSLHIPSRIEYKVVHVNTGNYAATMDNGLVVMVPTYIKVNDYIEVHTNRGEFLRRSVIG